MPILPSLFLSHGAPDLVLSHAPAARFLGELGQSLPRPRAVVVASAHWTTTEVAVGSATALETIHDFAGFSPELNTLRYPAPGDPVLAEDIVARLAAAGIAAQTAQRGLDHGAWVPLRLMYPAADLPVVPISVQPRRDGRHHLALGNALAELRESGVLIIGSGSATHNLGELQPGLNEAPAWVTEFDDWLVERAAAGDTTALADWQRLGPHGQRNHPSPEHWLPLLVAMGASAGAPGRVLHRSTTFGVLRMTMLAFGA